LEAKLKNLDGQMYRLILGGVATLLISIFAVVSAAADDVATCIADGADAIPACDAWIRQQPKNAVAYCHRGEIYRFKSDYNRAISDFSRAIQLDPTYVLAYGRRGESHYGKHEYDLAMADYEKALKLDPQYWPAVVDRGRVYEEEGDVVRAFAEYDRAIKLAPDSAGSAYVSRGHLYELRGNHDRAFADFDQAIKIRPNHSMAYNNRGWVYEQRGDYDRAIADLDQAIKINPNFALAHRNRGLAYSNKGEYDQAIADLEEAIRLDPADPRARQDLERAEAARAVHPTKPPAPATAATLEVGIAPATASAAPEVRVALVIGNAAYRSVEHLSDPRRDAEAVADALRQAGFQTVQLAEDVDHDATVKALSSFRDVADNADWALIYFAGHGIEINGANYLVPVDAKLADDRDVQAETIPYEDLLSAVGRARVLRLIILDACRVNPFKGRMRRAGTLSRGIGVRGLAPPPESEPGTLVVYSAKDGEVAADDANGVNSPFARAFVQEVKVPGLEVRRLFDYVRDDVIDATNNRQEPFTYGSLPGRRDFYFVAAH
jgi:tetratricopeptide (TPR) repeat protein